MSFEYPEAKIVARQLDNTIRGKIIKNYDLKDYERIHKIGFINKDLSQFARLKGRTIEGASSRGNTIRIKLNGNMNLLLAPEYGGYILYNKSSKSEARYHLMVSFSEGDSLTIRLTSMGVIYASLDKELEKVYIYKRDYRGTPSPDELTKEQFSDLLSSRGTQLKPLLVGKDAVLVGLSNSAFQDALYRSGIHPRRRASDMSRDEMYLLYSAIIMIVEERLKLGGKDEFYDIFGRRGGYAPIMGSNMKDHSCPKCGARIEKVALGGGQVYYCPGCQV
jgi:formamidopyrimidine-DNA glycosylase